MVKLDIAVNNDALIRLQGVLAGISAGVLPKTAGAMNDAAHHIRQMWMNYAGGGSLPGVEPLKHPSGGYARSIKIQRNGPFDYEVYSKAKVAEWIENGTDALDMKKTHPYGPRSRVSKKGVPYLIIPFRWGSPGATGFKNIMPQAVYNIIKNKKRFAQSRARMTTHNEPNARGDQVARREYEWGDRLGGEEYKGTNLEGMVSMEGQVEGGRKRASGYFTFRVISANSPQGRWVRPAVPARAVTRAVAAITKEIISEAVDAALIEDLGL